MSKLSDELQLIRSVLNGYKDSIAKSDALRAVSAIEAAVLEAQWKQEPVAWMHWYKYYDGTDVVKVAIGHAPTFNDQSPFRSEPLYAAPVVQPGYKLLKDTTHDERSWPEDSSHENGAYFCMCHHCGRQFTGYKRRVTCKVCAAVMAVIAAADGKSND